MEILTCSTLPLPDNPLLQAYFPDLSLAALHAHMDLQQAFLSAGYCLDQDFFTQRTNRVLDS